MKPIYLILPSTTTPRKVEWHCVPKIGDKVYYKTKFYKAHDVYHNIDENKIKVLLTENF